MIVLLDAHAFLWWLAGDPKLQPDAASAIEDPVNDVLVSAATIWEIAIKREMGKLQAPEDLSADVERAGFSGLPISLADARRAGGLPRHHRDPFDRMLIAQALRLEATIVSRDRSFDAYGVPRLAA
jgi:PIN domain nuclease of toxin-antitoxin system